MKSRFNLNPKGPLTIWERPEPRDSYIIGGDGSEGVVDGDNSCAQVISRSKFKQVAVWHGKIEPYEWGRELFMLGLYYNTALLAVERNLAGGTTIDCLLKMAYPNLYKMIKFDQGEQDVMDRYGWITTIHSRALMIGNLRDVVRENSLVLSDPDTLSEMKTFVKNPPKVVGRDGKIEASPGNNDDRVMSLAIACYLHKSLDMPVPPDRTVLTERLGLHDDSDYVKEMARGGY